MAASKLQPQLTVPSVVTQNIAERKQKAKAHYDKCASKQLSEFTIGERVFVKPSPRNRSKPWLHGEVVNKRAPRSCTVSTPVGLVRGNHTQIRKASTAPVHSCSEPVSIDTDVASDMSEQVDNPSSSNSGGAERVEQPENVNPEYHASPEIVLRRSSRNQKLPSRFKDYVMTIINCVFSSLNNVFILLCIIFLTHIYVLSVTVLTLWVAPPEMFCNWYRI